jgi:uncharacterized protein YjbK
MKMDIGIMDSFKLKSKKKSLRYRMPDTGYQIQGAIPSGIRNLESSIRYLHIKIANIFGWNNGMLEKRKGNESFNIPLLHYSTTPND